MIRIVVIAALLLALFVLLKHFASLNAAGKKKFWAWFMFALFFSGVLLLTVTGRLHVVAAVIAGAIPFLKRLLPLVRYIPLLRRFYRERKLKQDEPTSQDETSKSKSSGTSTVTIAEAYAVLGLTEGASRQEVIDAHRTLMQKLHPDRGGNDYLAAQLNQSKDLLLSRLS